MKEELTPEQEEVVEIQIDDAIEAAYHGSHGKHI